MTDERMVAGTGCRFCGRTLSAVFVDLGMSPLANSYIAPERSNSMEPFYPLRALVCDSCYLVQLEQFESPEYIFSDYPYFSSYSSSWLDHSRTYAEQIIARLGLDERSRVVEIASNDGYLLRFFRDHRIPVLGIEPAANVAQVALERGVPTLIKFFGKETARELVDESPADLLIGNNVLAHVPDLNDFVAGMKILLKQGGVITLEFPHLMRMIDERQWDTIYHEHFSYFSFTTVTAVMAAHGLRIFDVEELSTHGGSLRIFATHREDIGADETAAVRELREREQRAGYRQLSTYLGYGRVVEEDKRRILEFLFDLRRRDLRVVGYGAPAKGNTLLNYCGIRRDLLEYTCDANPNKQGYLLPGSHIPIRAPEAIRQDKPDVVVILPWNLKHEITHELGFVRDWGGRFAARGPDLEVLP